MVLLEVINLKFSEKVKCLEVILGKEPPRNTMRWKNFHERKKL